FRARADPLAGADFTRRVVIILRQVFVKVTLGIAQIFLRNGSKHKASFYPLLKWLCSHLEQSLISSFIVLLIYPQANLQRCARHAKCVLKCSPAAASGIKNMNMDLFIW